MDTMFTDLHNTLEYNGDGFHMLSQGLREEVERVSRSGHQWDSYNVDQLVCVCVCLCVCDIHRWKEVQKHKIYEG